MEKVTSELINMENFMFGNIPLAKKYNAIKRFINNKETILENGCLCLFIKGVEYYREQTDTFKTRDYILVNTDRGYTYEITQPKELFIDRKYNTIELRVK